MGPIWGQQDPGGPHVGPVNLAIWVAIYTWATKNNHTGWPAAVSSGIFAQWLILSYIISCYETVMATAKDKILNLLCNWP